MTDFSSLPAMQGFFAPTRFEADVYDCEVEGRVPSDLQGAFVRLGGDWLYPPKDPADAPFSQDGYVNLFRFKSGRVDYKGRWVKTARFKADQAANRQLFGNYRNPFTDDPSVKGVARTVSNTTPLAFAGKLFTLKEDGLPYEINPKTLDTIGQWDFHGAYKSETFTAHPKIDPVTGEMVTYGYEATGLLSDDLFLYTMDKTGKVTREVRLKMPYVSMVHDIAVTQKHVILPVFGYTSNLERLKAGKVHWGWDDSLPTWFGIIPRDGEAKDIRWFKGPRRAIIHTFNARSVGNKVVFEAPIFDGPPFPFFPPIDGSKWDPSRARALIRRITFDLKSKGDGYTEEILYPQPVVDLVRIDNRYLTQKQRYGYMGYADPARPFNQARAGNIQGRVTNCYGRYDFDTGKMSSSFFAGDVHSLQECCFVPRSKDAPEGDGYLMGVASNYAEMRTELVIADAMRLEEGAIARVKLPFRSTAQVHGIWVGETEVPFA
jgi:carotenoid cleavage dioxygenase-like enzyme